MAQAHQAWRESLRAVTLGQILDRIPQSVRERNRTKLAFRPAT